MDNIGLNPDYIFYYVEGATVPNEGAVNAALSDIMNIPQLQSWTVFYANNPNQSSEYIDELAKLLNRQKEDRSLFQWELLYGNDWFKFLREWSGGQQQPDDESTADAADGLYKTILYRIGLSQLPQDKNGIYIWPNWDL